MTNIKYSGYLSELIWFFFHQQLVKSAKIFKKSDEYFIETDKYKGKILEINNGIAFFYRYLLGFGFIFYATTTLNDYKSLLFTYFFSAIIAWIFYKGFDIKRFLFIVVFFVSLAILNFVFNIPKNIIDIPRVLAFMPNTVIAFYISFTIIQDFLRDNYKRMFIIKDVNITFAVEGKPAKEIIDLSLGFGLVILVLLIKFFFMRGFHV